jgi:hypothetical protein
MRHTFRLGRGARWLPALGASIALAAIAPSAASANVGGGSVFGSQFDPQTTNVPYLAWNGEEIRLESCVAIGGGRSYSDAESAFSVNDGGKGRVQIPITPSFLVEDWSGTNQSPNLEPQIEPNTVDVFLTDDYHGGPGICAEGDTVSLYPGMARIELDVSASIQINTILGNLGLGSAQTLFKTQYLAGWMQYNTPSIHEMAASDFGDSTDAANAIGDPAGDGVFNAGGKDGYVDVHVTGTMPLSGQWGQLLGENNISLPAGWLTLAQALASDSNPLDTTPWDRWDTSGDPGDFEGHSVLSGCNPDTNGAPDETSDPNYNAANTYVDADLVDNGDNCDFNYGGQTYNGDEDGPFSTAFGLSGNDAVGPYDPIDGYDTNLPDGNLSTADAPMPAARVDVAIAQSEGADGTGGAGSLEAYSYNGNQSADKQVVDSRDFTGNPSPHNLYSPFYDEYIPATNRGDASSGIDGSIITGDFPNFFGAPFIQKYHFWTAIPIAQKYAAATGCFNEAPYGKLSDNDTNPYDYQQSPGGPYDVAVYTDQNGEAMVKYNPGTGFNFDDIAGILHNGDNGCDLQALLGKTIGTSVISATAKYPFKPVSFPSVPSGTITKTVKSLWSKTIGVEPKGDGENQAQVVAVHAQDITGAPYAGEVVCFTATNANLTPFFGTVGGVSYAGEKSVVDPATANGNSDRTCVTTDYNGNAAVVAIQSESVTVDVNADFVQEGIMRDITYPGNSGVTQGTLPPPVTTQDPTPVVTAGSIPAGSNNGATPPSLAKVESLDPSLAKQIRKSHKIMTSRVSSLRLVMPSHHTHYLLVKIASGHKTARLSLTLQVRNGKKVARVHRTLTVRTNHSLRIQVAKNVTKIVRAHLS